MLAIRLQRTGRKGHAHYRVVVQDARRNPKSGNIVTSLGSFDPHVKTMSINKEKTETFISNGAQPSPRVAKLLKDNGYKLPDWVSFAEGKERTIKNQEKLRRNRSAETEVVAGDTLEETSTDAGQNGAADETTSDENMIAEKATEEVAQPEEPSEVPAES